MHEWEFLVIRFSGHRKCWNSFTSPHSSCTTVEKFRVSIHDMGGVCLMVECLDMATSCIDIVGISNRSYGVYGVMY